LFTGIIEETGKLANFFDKGNKRYLIINCQLVINDLKIGDSISCNGICLTVIEFNPKQITVEVMPETLHKSTVKFWKAGTVINLERAMSANNRFAGHIVQGHVDTTARLISREIKDKTVYLWIELHKEFHDLVTWQGSITVNGVSLTIARIEENRFAVALISHTLNSTNLNEHQEYLNLEFDIIGKYILRYLQNRKKPEITEEWLREKGF